MSVPFRTLHASIGNSAFRKCRQFMTFSWWRHQMETFSALLALCAGIHRSPVNSPHKGQWRGALMFSLICVWINAWANNRETGDLRRHRAHYDAIVKLSVRVVHEAMWTVFCSQKHCRAVDIPSCYQLIEAETWWTPFCRRHFEVHFLEWKSVNSD